MTTKKLSCFVLMGLLCISQIAVGGSLELTNQVKFDDQSHSLGVSYALKALRQDIQRKLGTVASDSQETVMSFKIDSSLEGFDRYTIDVNLREIIFTGSDELGLIHGIYAFSQDILGIDPCIYFTGLLPDPQKTVTLQTGQTVSRPYTFKHRIMFVNDEDLIVGFQMEKLSYGMNMEFMEKLFETMLRLGMTGVIPSTNVLSDEPHLALASDMGLYIAQHHAEPLGSVPIYWPKNIPYSWSTHKKYFIQFWSDAIQRQKGKHVIWTLNFRGLLDRPFWRDDPTLSEDSPRAEKAQVVNDVIWTQYNLLKQLTGQDHPMTATYLWGELGGLYASGLLKYPEDTIILFNDSGNGIIPESKWKLAEKRQAGKGIYQHVSYHCHRSSIRINSVHPTIFQEQTARAVDVGATDMMVLNVGNFKEKIFGIRQMVNLMNHFDDYQNQPNGEWYFDWYGRHVLGSDQPCIAESYRAFINNPLCLQSPSKILGDEFFAHYLERVLNLAYQKKPDDQFYKEVLTRSNYQTAGTLSDFREQADYVFSQVLTVLKKTESKWQIANERAFDNRRWLSGSRLDFYNSDLVWPTLKMMHLTGMAVDFTESIQMYLQEEYHRSQLSAYQALRHARAALDVEEKIEQAGWGRFADWYDHDENARVWAIEDMLNHYIDHIKDLKFFNYSYDMRNSKTPQLQYKYQPTFPSAYRKEITHMINGE